MSDKTEIYVRAHCVAPQKRRRKSRRRNRKWPRRVLVFDCETRLDTAQKLTFGAYRWCEIEDGQYRSFEEGLFLGEDLDPPEQKVLRRYVNDQRNFPKNDSAAFVPQHKLNLLTRAEFIQRMYWKAVRKGYLIVGFNLPFDISRLAESAHRADEGGWSLALSHRRNPQTKKMEPNPWRPRIVIQPQSGRASFIHLPSIHVQKEWKKDSRFLDLRTLAGALKDETFSLKTACEEFKCLGKPDHEPTGRVTFEEINYCRDDVTATFSLLNAVKKDFDQHPIDLEPDKAYSTASYAKSYLEKMGIKTPKSKFEVPSKTLGIAMQAYYGGRAECRIRRTTVPVLYTDFTSQYPTANALLGNWDVLRAEEVSFVKCTDEIRALLPAVTLASTFNPEFWKKLSFFALVEPEDDVLPVRALYNNRTQNIGLNVLSSDKPVWYAGPDLVASILLSGKIPKIIEAIRLDWRGREPSLKEIKLRGDVPIDPNAFDFFRIVVEQKSFYKKTDQGLSHFLKILGNSGSYGLFVEVNPTRLNKPTEIQIFSGEIWRGMTGWEFEAGGKWYFPPLATLITSGGRLLLAMLERGVTDEGGSYVFCDTDSMCIVASEAGGVVPCLGGPRKCDDGTEAVKALSYAQVEAIKRRFNSLNPYDSSVVPDLLKIEDVNYVDGDRRKGYVGLFAYAVSSKRYALFSERNNQISIVKCSGHGLGYLLSPLKNKPGDDKLETPRWVTLAWEWLLRNEFGLPARAMNWLELPAMMRMSMTSPNIMRNNRPPWLTAFNFFLLPMVSKNYGYPAGYNSSNFRFITPFRSNPREWQSLKGINLLDGRSREFQLCTSRNGRPNVVVADTYRIVLNQLLKKPEPKSHAPDGSPCSSETKGLLKRAVVKAEEIVPVGKETDRTWDEAEDMSIFDFKLKEFREKTSLTQADASLLSDANVFSIRQLIRTTKLSQKAIYSILQGQPVRKTTLDTFRLAVEGLKMAATKASS